jgi:hypothetical protein
MDDPARPPASGAYIPANRLFAGWVAADSCLCIEFTKPLLEEIRRETVLALHGPGRGGVEIAGLLLGTKNEGLIRVLRWSPLSCHYTKGPVFALDAREQAALACRLDAERTQAGEQGMTIVGWFVSRRRGAVTDEEPAAGIHRKFFSEPGQILLAITPQRFGEAEVSVYRRDSASDALAALPPAFYIDPLPVPASAAADSHAAMSSANIPPKPRAAGAASRKLKIFAAIAAGFIIALAVVGFVWRRLAHSIQPPVLAEQPLELPSLNAQPAEGKLRITWNPRSEAVLLSEKGRLVVRDGGNAIVIELKREDLRAARVDYPAAPQAAEITLEMARRDGSAIREVCNYRDESSASVKPSPVPPEMRPPDMGRK